MTPSVAQYTNMALYKNSKLFYQQTTLLNSQMNRNKVFLNRKLAIVVNKMLKIIVSPLQKCKQKLNNILSPSVKHKKLNFC